MKPQVLLLSVFTVATFSLPAFAADSYTEMLNVRWGKNAFNFEGMPSGPQPLKNLSRRPDGTADAGALVGDWRNPILTPQAAAVVKQKGDLAASGTGFPNSQDQCRAVAPPFTFAMQLVFEILQKEDGNLTIVYRQNDTVRHIRMNASHPAHLVPTPMGDSVGHWQGDALVIDTIGVKVDKFTSIDRFGTPQSDKMHVIERYRLIDGRAAKAQTDAYERSEGTVGGGGRNGGGRDAGYNPDTSLKGLELDATMEDPNVFAKPLTARVTYRHVLTDWEEDVCADNPNEYYKDQWIGLPKADHPDF
jgi:hypothetical protein